MQRVVAQDDGRGVRVGLIPAGHLFATATSLKVAESLPGLTAPLNGTQRNALRIIMEAMLARQPKPTSSRILMPASYLRPISRPVDETSTP